MTATPRRLTAALLFAVLALCIYRARTQSFVIDEAWVFELFVDQPLVWMAKSWDSCNHVLHTLLMKFCRNTWGISEHVLRIPSLLGAALYLSSVYALTRLLFAGWRQLLAAALLTMHPLVLDLLVAARGYGLALGLFGWSLHCAVSYCVRGWDAKWLARGGVLAGLSIAANLTFAVPVVAMGAALWWMRKSWRVIDWYFGPAFLISTLIVLVPLLAAQRKDFYFGAENLLETFGRMYASALKSEYSVFDKVGGSLLPWSPFLVAILVGSIVIIAAARMWRRDYLHFREAPFALVGATLGLCIVLATLLGLAGIAYPLGRTGLYLIPLLTLATMLLFGHRRPGVWIGLLAAAFYAGEMDNRYFGEWRYDAGTRDLIRLFDQDRAKQNLTGTVRIGVPLNLSPSAKYYRLRRNTPWMEVAGLDAADAQYALFDSTNAHRAASPSYEPIAKHPVSGAVLVRRLP